MRNNYQLLRSYVSPDAKLLIIEFHSPNNNTTSASALLFFKINFPTAENQYKKYGLEFIDQFKESGVDTIDSSYQISKQFFCAPIFLQKVNGVLYFVMMQTSRIKFIDENLVINFDSGNYYPAQLNFYAFDGKYVVKSSEKFHQLGLATYVNSVRSRSWLFENVFRNTHGWAQWWRDCGDMDEILPINAKNEPVYLPKDVGVNSNCSTSIYSISNDWKICKFTFQVVG